MRRVGEKMRSRKGASMLFALLVFMLCILAGTAALTAAAANSGRYTHMEAEQQDYLSVASAARVVRDEILDGTFEAKFKAVKEDKNITPGDPGDVTITVAPTPSSVLTGTFSDIFKEYFTYLYKTHKWGSVDADIVAEFARVFPITGYTGDSAPFDKKTLTVSGIDGMSNVTLVLDVDGNYNITATLYTGSDADHKRNETVVELKAEVKYTDDVQSESYYYAVSTATGTVYRTGIRTTVERNVEVTWKKDNVTISDGGAVS